MCSFFCFLKTTRTGRVQIFTSTPEELGPVGGALARSPTFLIKVSFCFVSLVSLTPSPRRPTPPALTSGLESGKALEGGHTYAGSLSLNVA